MPVYMVERELKGITLDQLTAAQKLAIRTRKEMTAQGKNVRYIRSIRSSVDQLLASRCDVACQFDKPLLIPTGIPIEPRFGSEAERFRPGNNKVA